jgi:hypothetical protein
MIGPVHGRLCSHLSIDDYNPQADAADAFVSRGRRWYRGRSENLHRDLRNRAGLSERVYSAFVPYSCPIEAAGRLARLFSTTNEHDTLVARRPGDYGSLGQRYPPRRGRHAVAATLSSRPQRQNVNGRRPSSFEYVAAHFCCRALFRPRPAASHFSSRSCTIGNVAARPHRFIPTERKSDPRPLADEGKLTPPCVKL